MTHDAQCLSKPFKPTTCIGPEAGRVKKGTLSCSLIIAMHDTVVHFN